jgi:hypothetical protein
MERLEEALNYYASLFDCLERASAAQAHRCAGERARAERLELPTFQRRKGTSRSRKLFFRLLYRSYSCFWD